LGNIKPENGAEVDYLATASFLVMLGSPLYARFETEVLMKRKIQKRELTVCASDVSMCTGDSDTAAH